MPTALASDLVRDLPTPIAAPWARLDTSDDPLVRQQAVQATVESTFRLLVAAMLAEAPDFAALGWVQDRIGRGTLGALREILEASRAAEGSSNRAIARQVWSWVGAEKTRKTLAAILDMRNAFAHSRVHIDEPGVGGRADQFRRGVEGLLPGLAWLGTFELVVVERTDLAPDGRVTARVRHFRGPAVPSRLVTTSWRGSLAKDDGALLHVPTGTALPLAPWAGVMHTPESGLCAFGLFDRCDRDGALQLRSPLQSDRWPPQRSVPDMRRRSWMRLEALDWTTAPSTKLARAAARPPGPNAAVALPAPSVIRSLAEPSSSGFATAPARIDRVPLCPSCGRERTSLRAPAEPSERRFVRCETCRTVAMLKLRTGAGYADPAEVVLWREAEPVRTLPAGTGPTLVCLAGPREGETFPLALEPARLGVRGHPDRPSAVVALVRTARRRAFAIVVRGAMRLAKDGIEGEVVRLNVGDRFEVGKSTYSVVSLGR